jgi:hypothetical protein
MDHLHCTLMHCKIDDEKEKELPINETLELCRALILYRPHFCVFNDLVIWLRQPELTLSSFEDTQHPRPFPPRSRAADSTKWTRKYQDWR